MQRRPPRSTRTDTLFPYTTLVRSGAQVYGPAAKSGKIPTLDHGLREGDTVRLGDHVAIVIETPAHTAGHVSFHLAGDHIIFVGDTLFAMGCGRLFEGDADQMFANMQRFKALSDDTTVYCAHEYTQSNGRFALVAEPDNVDRKSTRLNSSH